MKLTTVKEGREPLQHKLLVVTPCWVGACLFGFRFRYFQGSSSWLWCL